MRIHALRFKNINSLAGEWQVDFTLPDYTADGIFAITGPTGAGKTTLLDVICLALYGRTPRLERVNKSGNDVMTRQTGECFAEVTFSTAAGTFRCHWSQHRARKKADGDLQTPKHEISDAISGKIIDNQIRTVEKRIEETTGMDFQRFTQSMMLAQGGFAAFLKASADERAPILEQITGTGIYSDISIKVHERHALERSLLQSLQGALSGLQLLTPEQELTLRAEEAEKAKALLQQQTVLSKQRQHCEWKRQCLQLEKTIAELSTRLELWQQHHDAFTPQRVQLEQANRALELSGQYSALAALRQSQQDDLQRALRAQDAEATLQKNVAAQKLGYQQAESARQETDSKLVGMRPVFKQVHVLDSKISQQRTQLSYTQAEYAKRSTDIDKIQQQTNDIKTNVDQASQSLNALLPGGETSYESVLQGLTQDCNQKQALSDSRQAHIKTLMQGRSLSQWRQQNDHLLRMLSLCEALAGLYKERHTLLVKAESRRKQIQEIGAELSQLSGELTQTDELMRAREITLMTLREKQALLQTIKNLESQRAQLMDGYPCPLCGSEDHPYASHAPDADVESLNRQLSEAEILLSESRHQSQQLLNKNLRMQEKLNHLEIQYKDERQSLEVLDEKITAQTGELKLSGNVTLDEHRRTMLDEQEGIKKTLDQIEQEQLQLAALDKAVRDAHEKRTEIEKKLTALAQQHERLLDFRQQLDKLCQHQHSLQVACEAQQQTLDQLLAQRHQLLGHENADQLEAKLEADLAVAGNKLQTTLAQLQLAEKNLDANRQHSKALTQQISERAEKIVATESAFSDLLKNKGFFSETDYLAANLADTERLQLLRQSDQLKQQGTELQVLLKQSSSELDKLLQQALTTEALESLQYTVEEQEKRVSQLLEAIGGIRRDLSTNEQTRKKQQQQADKIDAQKAELERWAALHELIGSADGKKFRNFAQGLTFELMISHANQQLAKMTDRYLLLRDKDQPLDLNVIDHYQAGEIRSTKNLSGGESFIVSLALALGLSRMASRNVRVDSLFLDEGFGTLDEDALDTALDTLASLQQEGKLIGIISHIPALKERISTQIKVSPGTGGRSTLSGPGCRAR